MTLEASKVPARDVVIERATVMLSQTHHRFRLPLNRPRLEAIARALVKDCPPVVPALGFNEAEPAAQGLVEALLDMSRGPAMVLDPDPAPRMRLAPRARYLGQSLLRYRLGPDAYGALRRGGAALQLATRALRLRGPSLT